jgi:ABC-type multidrug transport system fused ATPase/permease subunit
MFLKTHRSGSPRRRGVRYVDSETEPGHPAILVRNGPHDAIIAHRLAAIRDADRIVVVITNGIAEQRS